MAFQDKFRAFTFGLEAGVPAVELAGEKVLLFMHVPLELESGLARWLLLHEDLLHRDSAACALRFDGRDRMGITWDVWARFLDWMGAPISELHNEPVLYLDAAPVELRAALRHWLDASPDDFTRHDDSGRSAITWAGWEAFLRSMKRTLAEALDAQEQARERTSGA